MHLPPRREDDLNFSNHSEREAFAKNTENRKDLLQKEISVNIAEQNLLKKRVELMSAFLNDLPSSDPDYSMMAIQIKMDLIEIDELKAREEFLRKQIG
jgi:hypothetical protein